MPEDFAQQVSEVYSNRIDDIINKAFEKLPLTEVSRNKLRQLATLIYSRDLFSNDTSGVVVAGFGKDEIFPSVYSIVADGVILSKLKHKLTHNITINDENSAIIIPFAQHEMVDTFLEGVDPDYNVLIDGYLEGIFSSYPKTLIENLVILDEGVKQEILNPLIEQSKKILKKLRNDLLEYKQRKYTGPIIDAVAVLPKDELAEMAESLVNLTSFKRRVSMEADETVGGPIDVAVISKGDGFVWIKRKHYFDANLNPQFISNYFRDH